MNHRSCIEGSDDYNTLAEVYKMFNHAVDSLRQDNYHIEISSGGDLVYSHEEIGIESHFLRDTMNCQMCEIPGRDYGDLRDFPSRTLQSFYEMAHLPNSPDGYTWPWQCPACKMIFRNEEVSIANICF